MVYEICHKKYEKRDVTHEIWQIWYITYETCCVIYEIRDMRYEIGNKRCELWNMKYAIWYATWAVKYNSRDIICELWDAGHGVRMRTCRGTWICTYWNLSYGDSTLLLFKISDQRILHMQIRKFGSYSVGSYNVGSYKIGSYDVGSYNVGATLLDITKAKQPVYGL